MTGDALMQVQLRLPTRTLFSGPARHVFAVALDGAFGLLPRHADHVASLQPSVLIVTDGEGVERFFGIDHGLLVKHGAQVDVVVRRGVAGDSLERLSETVDASFMAVDEHEREARTALSRLEVGIVRQLGQLRKPGP